MNYAEFVKTLDDPKPVYLLVTDQSFLGEKVLEVCRERVAEAARAFDWSTHDLQTDPPEEVVVRARTLPWMTPRRWLFVWNAHLGDEPLKGYLSRPVERTVLVLQIPKKVRGWPKLPSIEIETGTEALSQWVRRRASEEGFAISPDAVEMLVALVGEDLQELTSELEKVLLYDWERRRINVDSVLKLTLDARQSDVFDLVSAMAGRNREEALEILRRLFSGRVDPNREAPRVVALMYWSFKRILVARELLEGGQDFFSVVKRLKLWNLKGREREVRGLPDEMLAELLLRLRETDRLCKTSGADARTHLERVVIDTCRGRSV